MLKFDSRKSNEKDQGFSVMHTTSFKRQRYKIFSAHIDEKKRIKNGLKQLIFSFQI